MRVERIVLVDKKLNVMKKIVCLVATALFLSGAAAFAQGEMDAFKYSLGDLNGTARYLGMGGAFGALGGDISAMNSNPAGLGIYRSSEVVGTLSLSTIDTKSDWSGSVAKDDKSKVSFDNFAYVGYFPTANESGIMSWNIGISYNRLKNFNRNYRISGSQAYSMADYVADKAYGINEADLIYREGSYDPYNNANLPWMPVLGYEGGYFGSYPGTDSEYHSGFGEMGNNEQWNGYSPDRTSLNVTEKGAVDQYNFSFATNISNVVFIGANLAVTDINYSTSTIYDEEFSGGDHLYLDNALSSEGTGYSVNVGTIVRPVDFLRLGVAYNSPTWYKMTDYFHADAGTSIAQYDPAKMDASTPDKMYSDYELRTPDKWIFSAAAVIEQYGLISVDYEIANYKGMRLYDYNGDASPDNEYIKQDFGTGNMLKVGAEFKVTPQFAVRAGGAWQSSPVKTELKNGDIEVLTAGTLPHYTVDKGASYFTVGLGYRFTPNFYSDIACVFKTHKEDVYTFSRTFLDNGDVMVDSTPASLKTNTTRVALTLGYKF